MDKNLLRAIFRENQADLEKCGTMITSFSQISI